MLFDIKRFSVEDGPGVRCVVFLKGCPLRCVWCHNPESQEFGREILFSPEKCVGCGRCAAVCPNGCHTCGAGRRLFDRAKCDACGRCAKACFTGAIELAGYEAGVDLAMESVLADKPFYGADGGLTVSGGEPLAQFDFTSALLERARAEGVNTALDTCGFAPQDLVRKIFPLVDVWLYDLKCADSEKHKRLAGQPNALILENLRMVDGLGGRIIIRCPLAPGLNDSEADLEGIADIVNSLKGVEGVHTEPYHPIGEPKYARLGRKCAYTAPFTPKEERLRYIETLRRLVRVPVD